MVGINIRPQQFSAGSTYKYAGGSASADVLKQKIASFGESGSSGSAMLQDFIRLLSNPSVGALDKFNLDWQSSGLGGHNAASMFGTITKQPHHGPAVNQHIAGGQALAQSYSLQHPNINYFTSPSIARQFGQSTSSNTPSLLSLTKELARSAKWNTENGMDANGRSRLVFDHRAIRNTLRGGGGPDTTSEQILVELRRIDRNTAESTMMERTAKQALGVGTSAAAWRTVSASAGGGGWATGGAGNGLGGGGQPPGGNAPGNRPQRPGGGNRPGQPTAATHNTIMPFGGRYAKWAAAAAFPAAVAQQFGYAQTIEMGVAGAATGGWMGAQIGKYLSFLGPEAPLIATAAGVLAGGAIGAYHGWESGGEVERAKAAFNNRKTYYDLTKAIYGVVGASGGSAATGNAVIGQLKSVSDILAKYGVSVPEAGRLIANWPRLSGLAGVNVGGHGAPLLAATDIAKGLARSTRLRGFQGIPAEQTSGFLAQLASSVPGYGNPDITAPQMAPYIGLMRSLGMSPENIFNTNLSLTQQQAQSTLGMYASPLAAAQAEYQYAAMGTAGGRTGLTAQMIQSQQANAILNMGSTPGTLMTGATIIQRMRREGIAHVLPPDVLKAYKGSRLLADLKSTLGNPSVAMQYLKRILPPNSPLWSSTAQGLAKSGLPPGTPQGYVDLLASAFSGLQPGAEAVQTQAQSNAAPTIPPSDVIGMVRSMGRSAGLSPQAISAVEGIISKESGGVLTSKPTITYDKNGRMKEISYGVSQINVLAHPEYTKKSLTTLGSDIYDTIQLYKQNLAATHGNVAGAAQMWNPRAQGYGAQVVAAGKVIDAGQPYTTEGPQPPGAIPQANIGNAQLHAAEYFKSVTSEASSLKTDFTSFIDKIVKLLEHGPGVTTPLLPPNTPPLPGAPY